MTSINGRYFHNYFFFKRHLFELNDQGLLYKGALYHWSQINEIKYRLGSWWDLQQQFPAVKITFNDSRKLTLRGALLRKEGVKTNFKGMNPNSDTFMEVFNVLKQNIPNERFQETMAV